jgi:release factor glutamine methyltransferase
LFGEILDWTIRTTLEWSREHFRQRGEENPRLVAQLLVGYATRLSRLELYLNYDRPLSVAERDSLRAAIRRRDAGEPLQYITGHAPFRHLDLRVRPGVLIPRPETETLVGLVIAALPASARILEIGTGTGCIALALTDEVGDCQVVATDSSQAAVELACENAQVCLCESAYPQRLRIVCDDLAAQLCADAGCHHSFDVVVSNPPYIPTAALKALPREVADFEPQAALDGGADGLEVFRALLEQAAILLKGGGLVACELHQDCLEPASDLARDAGYLDVEIHCDLVGRPRFLTGRRA